MRHNIAYLIPNIKPIRYYSTKGNKWSQEKMNNCRRLLVSSTGYPHMPISQHVTLPLPFLWVDSPQVCIIITSIYIMATSFTRRCCIEQIWSLILTTICKSDVSEEWIHRGATMKLHIYWTLPDFMTQVLCSYAIYAAYLSRYSIYRKAFIGWFYLLRILTIFSSGVL